MLKFVLGIILGGLTTASYLIYPNYSPDLTLTISIVMVWATIFATALNYDSIITQKRNKIWEINKSVLLELTHVLSEVIDETESNICEEHERNCMHGQYSEREGNSEVYEQLRQKINYALNVYRPLMEKELSNEIENLKNIDKQISFEVHNEGVENLDAYEKALVAYKHLYLKMIEFVGEASGLSPKPPWYAFLFRC